MIGNYWRLGPGQIPEIPHLFERKYYQDIHEMELHQYLLGVFSEVY